MIKQCVECGAEFEARHGNRLTCSDECRVARKRRYGREQQRAYRQLHKDELPMMRKEYYRKFREKHLEEMRAYGREYYRKNREKRLQYHRRYYWENRTEILAQDREKRGGQRRIEKVSPQDNRYQQALNAWRQGGNQ